MNGYIDCPKCKKPQTIVNEFGCFCEDLCGLEEAKRIAAAFMPMCDALGEIAADPDRSESAMARFMRTATEHGERINRELEDLMPK